MDRIYLDNAATSFPKAPGVADAVADYLRYDAVNVSRGGYEEAYAIQEQIMDTRHRLLGLLHAPEDARLCFTSGATAALNQFLKGILSPGDHILVSGMEHNAVMRPLSGLAAQGVDYTVLPGDRFGRPDPARLKEFLRPDTKAVLCTHASNVTGTLMPLEGIGAFCRDHGLLFGVDAAQTFGSYPLDMEAIYADFIAFPGHKGLLGPQGAGGFAVREELGLRMRPLVEGGTGSRSDSEIQPDFLPDRFESGTLPIPAIIGLRQALIYLEEKGIGSIRQHEAELTKHFLEGLREMRGIRVCGLTADDDTGGRIGVVSVDFMKQDNAIAAFALEQEYGILTRVGLHCAPSAHRNTGTWPQGTVRFSFGHANTIKDADAALHALRELA